MQRAVFLDRDGVLNEERGFITCPEEFTLLRGVPAALASLHERGFARIVVTNQSGVARGLITLESLHAIHDKLRRETSGGIDAVYFCPHHPTEGLDPHECDCRKPKPGMLLQAAREHDIDLAGSWLVGDAPRDIEAGHRAGCRTICVLGVKMPSPDAWPEDLERPQAFVQSLSEACARID